MDTTSSAGKSPAGSYNLEVVINQAAYANVGSIGNSGTPADSSGHVPIYMDGVSVDPQGNIYTANGYDESGADVKKWDANGNTIWSYNDPGGWPYSIVANGSYVFEGVQGSNGSVFIRRLSSATGTALPYSGSGFVSGNIQLHGSLPSSYPAGTSART